MTTGAGYGAVTLHQCEAQGQEEVGGPLVPCDRPGTLRSSPSGSGRVFWVCEHHAERLGITTTIGDDHAE